MSNFWSDKKCRVFTIVAASVAVFAIVANVLAMTVFYEFLCLTLDRGEAIYAEGSVAMYEADNARTKQEAFENANKKNIEVCKDGFILLKNQNDALPLKKSSKISVFGKNSVNLSYGGSGSSGFSDVEYTDMFASLSAVGIVANPTLKSFYQDDKASGSKRATNSSDLDSGGNQQIATAETPQTMYTSAVKNSYADYSDAALVVITRTGGEGFDLPRYQGDTAGAVSADSHYLELDKNERDLLLAVCEENFKKVVVLFNIPSAFEATFLTDTTNLACADKIDSALWFGFTGGEGVSALGEILVGNVNPSGRTVDTWSADFTKDPTFVNFGTGSTPNDSDKYDAGLYYFVDYEEGVYVGYRYYETRGLTDGETWYDNSVVYPFGYGLSYTSFDWDVKSVSSNKLTKEGKITIEVSVTNTGSRAGKDVVQLYCEPPYVDGEIEKPAKILCAFAKTDELRPGRSQTVELTFSPYDVASYDYRDANGNGFCGYELDSGTYNLFVSKNAHESVEKISCYLSDAIRYSEDPISQKTVGNRYTKKNSVTETDLAKVSDSDAQLSTVLSRSNWTATWPTAPTAAERTANTGLIAEIKDTSVNNPIDYSEEDYPLFDEETTHSIMDLLPSEQPEKSYKAFVDYDNTLFDELISACSADDLIAMFNYAAYRTAELSAIKMPATIHADGPSGFTCFLNKKVIKGTCHYCSEPVMSSTWSTPLIQSLGNVIGEEGINGGSSPYSAIYAPGVNIHRSLFGGRCAEYFSEDPFLTGKFAAAEIRGCQEMGVICTIKHFALNEQETHRSINGDCSWVTEQAMREIYLKGFEIGIKESESRGIMTSFNRIGTKWTGGDYRLVTEILRGEWGFKGVVQCDFNTVPQYMNSRQMAYAGGDLNLATLPKSWCDSSETGDAIILQQCAKHTVYAFVNSNAMVGELLGYTSPQWPNWVYVIDGVLALALATWGAVTIVQFIRNKKREKTE